MRRLQDIHNEFERAVFLANYNTPRQRLLRAQTTLRDGMLPFSRPTDQAPRPSAQPSPRMRAQAEGGFADGSGERPARPFEPGVKPVGPGMKPPSEPKPEARRASQLRRMG